MTIHQAANHIGHWVRYRLDNGCQHLAQARIVGVRDGKVAVQPPYHKRVELVDAKELRLWKSRNQAHPFRTTGP